jgi:hypothetical protein
MSITIGRYSFNGPYTSTNDLEDRSGVYAIHCHRDNEYNIVDIGESATVKTRVENHDRKECWKRNCIGALTFSVYYTPGLQQAGRIEIEQDIRKQYRVPCGEK